MTFSTPGSAARARADQSATRSIATLSRARHEHATRFVDAARELANRTGSAAFTVHQVVEGAGLSLKSFYRCFRSKDELLVALLGADSQVGAAVLAGMMDAEHEPRERLHAFVQGIFTLATWPGAEGYAAVLVREHRRLSESHAEALDRALAPLVDLVDAELARLGRADPRRDAETTFDLIIGGLHDVAVGGADARDVAGHLWRFCWSGLGGTT